MVSHCSETLQVLSVYLGSPDSSTSHPAFHSTDPARLSKACESGSVPLDLHSSQTGLPSFRTAPVLSRPTLCPFPLLLEDTLLDSLLPKSCQSVEVLLSCCEKLPSWSTGLLLMSQACLWSVIHPRRLALEYWLLDFSIGLKLSLVTMRFLGANFGTSLTGPTLAPSSW